MGDVRRRNPAGWADDLVDGIARHKSSMLACSIALAAFLAALAIFVVARGDGPHLTHDVTDAGGYVAIVALVLGLPALGYAMVTDRAVEKLADVLSVTEVELTEMRGNIRETIGRLLRVPGKALPPDHHLQVFVPNRQRTLLLPAYDPTETGPEEGWEIDPAAPQAVTGSAWVRDEYYFALGEALSDPALRLTPEQHVRYERLTGVAAAPIHDEEGESVGVLTIFTDGEPHITDPDFIRLHLELADDIAPAVSEYIAGAGPLPTAELATPEQARGHDRGSIKRSYDDKPPQDA